MSGELEKELVDYAVRYGGPCRGCADEDGICPTKGVPCDPELHRRVLWNALAAWSYGTEHGFCTPFSVEAFATERAAREKAERETAERCAKIAEALYTEATVNRTKAGHPTLNGQLAIYVVGRVAEAIRKEFAALSPSPGDKP